MSRDHRRLEVFQDADVLVLSIYRVSKTFPVEERFGLQSQLRRAAVSIACDIVEGSARQSTAEYCHFLNVAAGSAAEARYLAGLSARLGLLRQTTSAALEDRFATLSARLEALIRALRRLESDKP